MYVQAFLFKQIETKPKVTLSSISSTSGDSANLKRLTMKKINHIDSAETQPRDVTGKSCPTICKAAQEKVNLSQSSSPGLISIPEHNDLDVEMCSFVKEPVQQEALDTSRPTRSGVSNAISSAANSSGDKIWFAATPTDESLAISSSATCLNVCEGDKASPRQPSSGNWEYRRSVEKETKISDLRPNLKNKVVNPEPVGKWPPANRLSPIKGQVNNTSSTSHSWAKVVRLSVKNEGKRVLPLLHGNDGQLAGGVNTRDNAQVGSGPKENVARLKPNVDRTRNWKKKKSFSKSKGSPNKTVVCKRKITNPSFLSVKGIVSRKGTFDIKGVKKCNVYQLRRIGQEMKLVMPNNIKKQELQNLIISRLNSRNREVRHRRNGRSPF